MGSLADAPIRYARAGSGVNIAYQVLGDGPVDILYVPGLLNVIEATAEVPALERHFERMASFSTVVMFDKRGTGLSDRVPAEEMADPASRLEDVVAVMDAAGLEQATLFATADGALVAIQCAATYQDRVRALIVLQGTARWLEAEGYEQGVPAAMASGPELWDEFWGNQEQPHVVDLVAPSAVSDQRWRRALGRIQRRAGTPAAAYRYWDATMVRGDVRDVLPDVAVPTLIMHSSEDVIIPVAQGRYLAENIPGAQFVELPGADHFHWFLNGDRVADESRAFLTGSSSSEAGGRRLATVLFTDIVGSTARAGELGDGRWRDLLEAHDQVVRRHVARYDGRVVKFTGDGFLILFGDPLAGVSCARELCAAVNELGIEMRAGVHTGLIELRDDDIAGMAVNVAARVLAQAEGSEVLVTRTVKDLLAGSGPPFVLRGVHELKGVPDTWELCAADG